MGACCCSQQGDAQKVDAGIRPAGGQLFSAELGPSPTGEQDVRLAEQTHGDLPPSTDPRWDRKSFEAFVREHAPLVRVRYLRSLPPAGLGRVPESELIFSVPADAGVAGLQLFAVFQVN